MIPPHLQERLHRVSDGDPTAGDVVLYWCRTAVRAHENPALDVAIHVGNALGVPVLVYHAVSERYPYASDRHHTFILQGARDLADELDARGIAAAFHVERAGHRPFPSIRCAAGPVVWLQPRRRRCGRSTRRASFPRPS